MCGNVKQNAETEFRNLKLIIISAISRTVKSTGNEGSKDRQMERDKGYNYVQPSKSTTQHAMQHTQSHDE